MTRNVATRLDHEICDGNIAAVHAIQHDGHRKIHVIGGDAIRDDHMGLVF